MPRRRLPAVLAALLACLLVLVAAPLPLPAADDAQESSAASTPDCGDLPDEPFPLLQRAKQLARLGVDRWHRAGRRGRGVKVAVLDTGFRGYRAQLGKALPEHVTARSFRPDGDMEARDSPHGILCSEVIHTLAPEAELLLATWEPDHPDQFLAAARWARAQGARIISCSVIMPSWGDGEGGGTVHEALSRVLGNGGAPGDLLCFASAGNIAQRHWAGAFQGDVQGFHQWQPGQVDNPLTPWGNELVSVELCWHAGADYDLSVFDGDTGAEVGRSGARPGTARYSAVIRFQPQPQHGYRARVRFASGKPGTFHLAALGSGLGYATSRGSIPFPADGPEVIAVGAVDHEGHRAGYSSCGPNSLQPKPDLVAEVPFPTLCRPRPFAGTSAAAPQAAGLACLLWGRHPDWTAARVRSALCNAARDLGPPGHDYETGYGSIALPDVAEEGGARQGELHVEPATRPR
jgi:subtilisin family serine protease